MVLCLQKHIDSIIVPALLENLNLAITDHNKNPINSSISPKMLIDIIPILSQIVQKHSKELKIHDFCWPLLAQTAYQFWSTNKNVNDEELLTDCKYIRRHYYNLLMIVCQNKSWLQNFTKNNEISFIKSQFLGFFIDGLSTSSYCDAQTIRNVILALNNLMREWSESNEIIEFFVVEVCPNVMYFPIHPDSKGFALADPQLGLAIKELASFVKFLYKKVGNDFLNFMASEILKKTMNLTDSEVNHFCESIQQRENKQWTQFIRQFYGPRMLR